MPESFAGFQLEHHGELPVLWRADDRFKTARVSCVLRRPLTAEWAAARSLLPGLLLQGSVQDPSRPALARRMESLYGAAVLPGTEKLGETHSLRMTVDVVAGGFLPGRPDQLGDGLRFLAEQLGQPRLEGDAFPAEVFANERDQTVRQVETLIDDRDAWAMLRALQHACDGEPMAVPEHGGLEEMRALRAGDPERARRDFLASSSAVLVASGALDGDHLGRAVAEFEAGLPRRHPESIGRPVLVDPRPPRQVVEQLPMRQARLVMVLRVPWSDDPDVWVARRLFVSMFGGGPHSRLFREVREERSLAYGVSAGLDRHKGLILVRVGLDAARAEEVVAECERQRAELAAGNFTDDELQTARLQHLSAVASVGDSVAGMVRFATEHWLAGLDRDPDQLAARYREIGRDDVVAAAAGIWLDVEYLLAEDGAEAGA